MNRLQLATLLSWAGETGFEGRKRLQKVVYLLQQAGCPLGCGFILHHFGPYSREVAAACDDLVAADLVKETGGPPQGKLQYVYTLPPMTQELLQKTHDSTMERFRALGQELIGTEVWPLELGATILFFHGQTGDWVSALSRACEFKKVHFDASQSKSALTLAQRVHAARVS